MDKYYYLDSEYESKGPFSLEEFLQEPVNDTTLIWRKGLSEWTRASEVAEVAELLPKSPTPPPFIIKESEPQPAACPQSGTRPFVASAEENQPFCPPSHLVWGILTTFLCNTILGIVSIYMATRVRTYYQSGQYEKAKIYSERAANWAIASMACAALFLSGYLGLFSITTFLAFLAIL